MLSEEILSLGKAETQPLVRTDSALNVELLCRELIADFQGAHPSTHRFCVEVIGVVRDLRLDRKFVHQVVTNLLSNAVKYSPSGGDVSLALQFEKNEFSIQVRDQGVGIPEADLEHLFDLFHRGQNADIAPGAGLGMVIVKHAVEAHGGTIQVNSKVGSGTAFTISLPC